MSPKSQNDEQKEHYEQDPYRLMRRKKNNTLNKAVEIWAGCGDQKIK